jgi:hypothetical protein
MTPLKEITFQMIKIQKFNNPSNLVIAYHGTNFNIEKFSHFSKEFSNDQYGPGIYFTNKESIAKKYGNNIYKVRLNTKNFITSSTDFNLAKVIKIINDNIDDNLLLNWNDNKNLAKKELMRATIDDESYYDTLQNIWSNVFNLKNIPYLNAMIKNKIDGLIIRLGSGIVYYIVYNPEIIK